MFVAAAVSLFLLVVFFIAANVSYRSATRLVDHTLAVREEADDWLTAMLEAEASQRAFLLSGDRSYLAPYESPRLDGLRLLVIDDEPDALAVVAEVLRERGAQVDCVSSAEEALARFSQVKPDVIVSDIGMPDQDGYTLIRKIRALSAELGGRTPAVALTAYARAEDAQRAFAAGYQVHVSKPVEPTQLTSIVANLGGRSHSQRS